MPVPVQTEARYLLIELLNLYTNLVKQHDTYTGMLSKEPDWSVCANASSLQEIMDAIKQLQLDIRIIRDSLLQLQEHDVQEDAALIDEMRVIHNDVFTDTGIPAEFRKIRSPLTTDEFLEPVRTHAGGD